MTTTETTPTTKITMTQEGLVELLTTAACIGRDLHDKNTRGEIKEALGAYGMTPSARLKVLASQANRDARVIALANS